MLSRRTFAIGIMLASAGIARANQTPLPVVVVQFVVGEQSPDRVEETVTNTLERILVKLPRVAEVNSNTGHRTVDVEIQFEGGATEQDLATVTQRAGQLAFSSDVLVISRSVRLGPSKRHFPY